MPYISGKTGHRQYTAGRKKINNDFTILYEVISKVIKTNEKASAKEL